MGDILTQAEMQASLPTVKETNCYLTGDDAKRFEALNLGDEVMCSVQMKVTKKENHFDSKGNKVFDINFYVSNVFPDTDIESKLENKVF